MSLIRVLRRVDELGTKFTLHRIKILYLINIFDLRRLIFYGICRKIVATISM